MALKATHKPERKARVSKEESQQPQQEITEVPETQTKTLPADPEKSPTIGELNPDFDGLEEGELGNRVIMDGTDFIYKNSDESAREILANIFSGRKLWQYWDEAKNLCQSFDGKVSTDGLTCATCDQKKSKKCRFKYEIHWVEGENDVDEEGQIIEYFMLLPTASAIVFMQYAKRLKNQNLGVADVVTKMTVKREQNRQDKSIRYSVVVFERYEETE